MWNIIQDWTFKIDIYANSWNIYFARVLYNGEDFTIRFQKKNFEKILDYLKAWHWKLNHDNKYVASMKHRVKQNNLLFYK